jgi:hypothetical protein
MRDGYRCLPTIRECPVEFEPYAPRYQPRSSECRVSIQANQEPKSSPIPKLDKGKEAHVATKKRSAEPKCRSISAIRDFPPILGRFNPYISNERKQAMLTQLTQILEEYTQMELEEIQLLKT